MENTEWSANKCQGNVFFEVNQNNQLKFEIQFEDEAQRVSPLKF